MDRGNDDEVAMRDNRAALEAIQLGPRVLIDVSKRSQEITLIGRKQAMPVIVAPTGSTGLAWYEGEIALARAAAAATSRTRWRRVDDDAENEWRTRPAARSGCSSTCGPTARSRTQLIARARDAGFEALVFTVDTPVAPGREYNLRNGFTIPFKFTRRNVADVLMHPRWLIGVLGRYVMTTGMPRYANFPPETQVRITALPMGRSTALNDTVNWEDVRELRGLWPGKLIVKGIQTGRDAVLAVESGADAVVLSNHGGRVLDSSLATIMVLPEVVDAVRKRIAVIVDSGFRRGSHVVKALALGADAVMIGRAPLHGTASGGRGRRAPRARHLSRRNRSRDGAARLPQHRRARPRQRRHAGGERGLRAARARSARRTGRRVLRMTAE